MFQYAHFGQSAKADGTIGAPITIDRGSNEEGFILFALTLPYTLSSSDMASTAIFIRHLSATRYTHVTFTATSCNLCEISPRIRHVLAEVDGIVFLMAHLCSPK